MAYSGEWSGSSVELEMVHQTRQIGRRYVPILQRPRWAATERGLDSRRVHDAFNGQNNAGITLCSSAPQAPNNPMGDVGSEADAYYSDDRVLQTLEIDTAAHEKRSLNSQP